MRKRKFTAEQATEAIGKTAKLLAKESVRVTTQGARAYITWDHSGNIDRINLPMVPRDASPEFLEALQGFLDHEVGHALNTEPVVGRQLEDEYIKKSGVHPQLVRGMCNIVEDVRIERCMEAEFPGSKRNLEAVRRFFVDDMQKPSIESVPPGPEYDDQRRAYVIPVFFRARGGQVACTHFMDDNDLWRYTETYDEVMPDLPERLDALKSTADAVRLACEIIELTNETIPPDDDEADQEDQDDSGEGDSSNEESQGGKGDNEERSDKEQSGGDESDGDSGDSDEKGDDDSNGAGSDGEESDSEDSGDVDGAGDAGDGDGEEEGQGDSDPKAKRIIKISHDHLKDFDEAAADRLEAIIGDLPSDDKYQIFSRDKDRIEPAPSFPHVDIRPMEASVEKTSSVLRKELQRLIAARSLDHMVPGKRSGRIHPSSLHRLKTGDDRVFARKHTTKTKDTAVSLVVDCSGSMGGTRIRVAMEAAWAFSDVLTKLKVKNEVIGFTTDRDWFYKPHARYEPAEVQRYARVRGVADYAVRQEPLYFPIFKSFKENFGTEQKRRMAHFPTTDLLTHNIDGESIRLAASRLAQEKASRHVMIVFSDGEPCSDCNNGHILHEDLKNAVKEIEDAGIETIGIGIQSSAVRKFYPKNFTINDASDLAGATLRELKALLIN